MRENCSLVPTVLTLTAFDFTCTNYKASKIYIKTLIFCFKRTKYGRFDFVWLLALEQLEN